MKNTTKRGLSLILVLAMCISLLSGLALTASAATYSPVANWGERGTVATELSDMAVAFYQSNGTSYSELAALSGASSTSSVPSSALYLKLQSLMETNHTTKTNYEEIKDLCMYTDCENSNTGSMTCLYCGKAVSAKWDSASTWNREHTWPKSKTPSGGTSGRTEATDIVMLRPTCPNENSSRGNTAYGEGSGYYDPNLGSENVHGDMARSVLFGYVRWGMDSYMWGSEGVMESKETLLEWMLEDPVDTWELGRNDSIESITGTRNVFVDYPELAFMMFEEDIPANYQTPSGGVTTESYHISAYSNNSTYGTVSLSGKTITATPKTGYYVAGYQVTSGTATVTRNGNTFLVVPESNCFVMINFAAKEAVTLSFIEDGVKTSTVASYGGDSVTLPSNKNEPAEGYSFVGWVTANVEETTEMPAAVYDAGSAYTATNQTFYALYAKTETQDGQQSGVYSLYTGALTEGDYLIVYSGGAMQAADADSSGRIDYMDVTVTDDTISLPDSTLVWHIAPTSDGYYTIYNEENGVYAAGNGTKNKAAVITAVTEYAKWTVTSGDTYEFVNLGNANAGVNKNLRKNGTYGYACYSTSTGGALSLYKGVSGTTYYTTDTINCEHNNIEEIPAVEATCSSTGLTSGIFCNDCQSIVVPQEVVPMTDHENLEIIPEQAPSCTETGLSEGIYCNDCQSVVVAQEIVAATGHSYNAVVTPPTTNTQGYTTYTCSVCGSSYVGDYTEALGEVYTVSFCVPSGVDAVADMECGKNGITLPSAGVPTGDHAYVFAGWAAEQVEDTETAPTLYTGTYTAKEDTTLYAVYTYSAGGSGTAAYKLVTSADQLFDGASVVIAAADYNCAIGTTQNSNNRAQVAVTKSGDTVSWTGSVAVFTLGAGTVENTWSFYDAENGGYLYAASSSKNYLRTTSTLDANGSFAITVSESGVSGVVAQGNNTRNNIRYNQTSSLFACYSSGQKDIALYVLTQDGTTYYTSLDSAKVVEAAVYTGSTLSGEYASFNDAVAACADGQYIKLLADAEAEVILEADLYIDLNGYSISGILEPDGHQIYGMDSTTDSYNGDSVGYFNCLDVNDQPVAPVAHFKSDVTGSVKRYMAIGSDAGYSFHRFYLGITHVSIKAATTGVGYKAVFAADETLQQYIEGFGYSLKLESYEVLERPLDDFVSKKVVALRVENFDLEGFGEAVLTAGVYMTVNGEKICSDTVSYSMKNMLEAASANLSGFKAEQIQALQSMIAPYADTVMAQWEIEALKQWTNN